MKYCTHCGNMINDGDIYCSVCGAIQSASTSSSTSTGGYYDQPPVASSPYQSYTPGQYMSPPPPPPSHTQMASRSQTNVTQVYTSVPPQSQPNMPISYGSPVPPPVADAEGSSMQVWIIGGLIIAALCVILGVVMLLNTDRSTKVVETVEDTVIIENTVSETNDYSDDPQLITVDPYPSSDLD